MRLIGGLRLSVCFDWQTGALLNALVQLCHIATPLAERSWVQLFPRLWKILSDRQQHVSALSSKTHTHTHTHTWYQLTLQHT